MEFARNCRVANSLDLERLWERRGVGSSYAADTLIAIREGYGDVVVHPTHDFVDGLRPVFEPRNCALHAAFELCRARTQGFDVDAGDEASDLFTCRPSICGTPSSGLLFDL